MGVRFRTNNGDRSALVGKYYSGCLCLLLHTTLKHSKRLYTLSKYFHNVRQSTIEPDYSVSFRALLFTE